MSKKFGTFKCCNSKNSQEQDLEMYVNTDLFQFCWYKFPINLEVPVSLILFKTFLLFRVKIEVKHDHNTIYLLQWRNHFSLNTGEEIWKCFMWLLLMMSNCITKWQILENFLWCHFVYNSSCFVRILCPDTTRILLYAQQHIQQLKDSQADWSKKDRTDSHLCCSQQSLYLSAWIWI